MTEETPDYVVSPVAQLIDDYNKQKEVEPPCPECDQSGYLIVQEEPDGGPVLLACSTCERAGWTEEEKEANIKYWQEYDLQTDLSDKPAVDPGDAPVEPVVDVVSEEPPVEEVPQSASARVKRARGE